MSEANFESYRQIMNKVKAKAKAKGDKEMVYDVNMADSIVWRIQREVNSMKRRHAKEVERIRREVIRLIHFNIIT